MSNCKYCQTPITWVKMDGKNIPLNMDGVTVHKCKDGVQMPGTPVSGAIDKAQAPIQQGTRAQYAPKGDDSDKQKLILWQSNLKIAIELVKMVGDFPNNDAQMVRRVAYITSLLQEEGLSYWRTGKLKPDIPQEFQDKINQIT
jgi:hypothetical protein